MKLNELSCLIVVLWLVAGGCRRKPPVNPEALHRAAEAGNLEWAQSLIDSGFEVNAKDLNGRTPLHDAAFRGCKDLVELFLEKGADIKATDNRGLTPSAKAALRGYQDIVELLRKYGVRE